ncbi:MAG: hypothetical protein PHI24_09285 [Desulfitobacteriaceae bacterium]|nr:hypothetical protein [Desulfitobacteriaceae bacterium]
MVIPGLHQFIDQEVAFSDDKRLFSQDIDLLDGYDLAIIWLKGKDLPSLQVSDKMAETGQSVTIIGNPPGFFGRFLPW